MHACAQAISTMLAQYGQQPAGYGLGATAGLDFGGGGGGNPGLNPGLRAGSAGSAYGSGDMSQGFQVAPPTVFLPGDPGC